MSRQVVLTTDCQSLAAGCHCGVEGLAAQELTLVLCRCEHRSGLQHLAEILNPVRPNHCSDPDLALELAENILLQTLRSNSPSQRGLSEGNLGRLQEAKRLHLQPFLKPRIDQAGERAILRGDRGDNLLFVESGRFTTSLEVELEGGQQHTRLSTVTAGLCVGEIVFLTGQPRTADVIADEDSRCWALSRASFEDLCLSHPQTGIQLLKALASEQGLRLAKTSYLLAIVEQL